MSYEDYEKKKHKRAEKRRCGKKGQATIYLVFMIAAILVVLIAAVMSPMGILFNVQMWQAGETILEQAQADLNNINDTEVFTAVNDTINEARGGVENNVDVLGAIFKYGWLFVVGIIAIILFLYSRKIVEYTGGFV